MAKIILNEGEFNLSNFVRNTVFFDDSVTSRADITLDYNSEDISTLYSIASDPITSITIKNSSNENIYELENINAKISSIDENLNDEIIVVNVNINFEN